MATQVSLNSGAVASAGTLALQTNGTTEAVSISTGQVATLAQNPILTSGTANGVAYLNGSKALTTGSALTFDGTTLGTNKLTTTGFATLGLGAVFTGASNNATGTGVEIGYSSGAASGLIQAYNRTGSAYVPLYYDASVQSWNISGSEQMRLTSKAFMVGYTSDAGFSGQYNAAFSGNVGIGTSSPAFKLDVVGSGAVYASVQNTSTGSARLRLFNTGDTSDGFALINNSGASGQVNILNYKNSAMGFWTNSTQAMTLDASGNLGVGTTSPTSGFRIDLQDTIARFRLQSTTGTNACHLQHNNTGGQLLLGIDNSTGSNLFGVGAYAAGLWYTGNYPLVFGTNNTERARIDSSGNLLVGTTSVASSAKVYISASANSYNNLVIQDTGTTGGSYVVFTNSAANVAGSISHSGTTTVAYNTSSDYRLKESIVPMTGALAKVAALKPVTYKWKSDGSDGEGFIAHELAEVCPHAVTGEKDAVDEDGNPKYQGIDTSFLVATLTAALQEQNQLIQSLTDRISALEGAKA